VRAVQYEEYFPTEDWRGGRGMKGTDSFVPSPLIVCRLCGHQEQAGGIMRFAQPDNADEDAAAREARMAREGRVDTRAGVARVSALAAAA
jgi:hypothetical protein